MSVLSFFSEEDEQEEEEEEAEEEEDKDERLVSHSVASHWEGAGPSDPTLEN